MSEIKAAKHSLNSTGNTYFQIQSDDRIDVYVKGVYAMAMNPTSVQVNGMILDSNGNIRDIPINSQTDYTLTVGDVGKCIAATGNVTVPQSVFSSGDVVSIYNNGTVSRNVVNSGAATVRLAGTGDANTRVLAQYGIATILCVEANTFVISGAGLT